MTKCKGLILLIFFAMMILPGKAVVNLAAASDKDSIKQELSRDETILFNLINDILLQNKMPVLPLSEKLCFVARTHIDDLIKSKPYVSGCGFHSWSESGHWVSCCHSKDPSGVKCMKSKPYELTGYLGNGYELIYSADDKALPNEAAELWKQVDASLDMILCKRKWKGFQWKMMGVAIKDEYALLWFGDKLANSSETMELPLNATVNDEGQKKPIENKKSASLLNDNSTYDKNQSIANAVQSQKTSGEKKYFLIVASLKTTESAQSELKQIKQSGNPEAFILESEGVFRIVVATFDSESKAKKRQSELKNKFPGIWIFKL